MPTEQVVPAMKPASAGKITAQVTDAAWDAAVARWLGGQIANSPVAQSTPAFNHLLAALPALRDELQKEMN